MQLPRLFTELRGRLHRRARANLDNSAALDLHLVYGRLGKQQADPGAILPFLRSNQNPVAYNNEFFTLGFHHLFSPVSNALPNS